MEDPTKDNVYIDFDTVILDYDIGLRKLGLVEQQFYYDLYHKEVIELSEPKKNTVQVIEQLRTEYNVIFLLKPDVRARLWFIKKYFPNVLTSTIQNKHSLGTRDKSNYLIDTDSFHNKESFQGTLFYLGRGYCKSTETMKVLSINYIQDVLKYL